MQQLFIMLFSGLHFKPLFYIQSLIRFTQCTGSLLHSVYEIYILNGVPVLVGAGVGVVGDEVLSVLTSDIMYTDMSQSPPHTAVLSSRHCTLQSVLFLLSETSTISSPQQQKLSLKQYYFNSLKQRKQQKKQII